MREDLRTPTEFPTQLRGANSKIQALKRLEVASTLERKIRALFSLETGGRLTMALLQNRHGLARDLTGRKAYFESMRFCLSLPLLVTRIPSNSRRAVRSSRSVYSFASSQTAW